MDHKQHGPYGPGMGRGNPGAQDPGGPQGPAMGMGPGPHGPYMGQDMGPGPFGPAPGPQHHWGGPQGPGFAYGPPPGAYAPGPGWSGYPPGFGPQQGPGTGPVGPDLSAAMNEFADQSGLGALKGFLNFNDGEFWKGALVGAAIVMLMTNEELRDTLLGGAARTANAMKAGLAGFGEGAADEAPAEGTDQAAGEEHSQ